jgi:hypothetical protein
VRDLECNFEIFLVARSLDKTRNRRQEHFVTSQFLRLLRAEKPNIIRRLLHVFLQTQSHDYRKQRLLFIGKSLVRGKLHVLERDQRQDTDDGLSFEESLNYSHFHGA